MGEIVWYETSWRGRLDKNESPLKITMHIYNGSLSGHHIYYRSKNAEQVVSCLLQVLLWNLASKIKALVSSLFKESEITFLEKWQVQVIPVVQPIYLEVITLPDLLGRPLGGCDLTLFGSFFYILSWGNRLLSTLSCPVLWAFYISSSFLFFLVHFLTHMEYS